MDLFVGPTPRQNIITSALAGLSISRMSRGDNQRRTYSRKMRPRR
jgi:hypothetical protein